ncbi:MAG: PAS domain-containing protein [Syntrophobacteraceae bacterium]
MSPHPNIDEDGNAVPASSEDLLRLRARQKELVKAAQAAIRDTTRLNRLFTILSEPAPLELMLDRVLSTLSELFASDIVVLVDPAGSGTFSPLASVGLPEYMIHLPMSSAESGCVVKAMATRTPIVKTEVGLDLSIEPQFRELDTETAVWIPVTGSHAARGVLILARCHPTPFAHADVHLLTAMAYRIGLALDQTQRNAQLEQIVQAGRNISRTLHESAVCTESVRMFPMIVGADAAALVLKDSNGTPRCVAQFGLYPASDDQWGRLAEHLLEEPHFDSFQPYSTSDLPTAVEAISMQLPDSLPVRALLAVPVYREERIHGLLYAMRFSTVAFSPDTLQIAMLYAAQTSTTLENAWLYDTVQAELVERMRAEQRLCESEERLQLALMGADLGMWDWNVVTGEVRFNERWPGMLGYSPNELEPHLHTREKLIHPDDMPYVREALQLHLEGHTPYYETEHRFLAKTGKWVWVLDKGKVTHRDSTARPLRFVGTCLDITEKKQIQAERFQIEQQKHHAWRAESLSRMAGGIAHHFNNLLQGVMGNLEMTFDHRLPGRTRELLAEAMKAASRASEISQLMLAYLGQKSEKTEPIDLAEAARAVLPLLISSMRKKIHLKAALPPLGPIILADGAHIKQIITNLISNAVEAIGEREGEIIVSIDVMSGSEIEASRFYPVDWDPGPGAYASLSVSDTGCGMDTTTRERIFEPFFTTKFTGRGLGMPVTLGLIRSYGGAIAVESQPDRGSTFRLIFPASKQQIPSSAQEESIFSEGLRSAGLVLVVDDDPMIRIVAQGQLQKLGYEVLEASDGVVAVDTFRAEKDRIDFVLLDLSMPGMDGWETMAAIRALRSDIPVVIASGYDEALAMQGFPGEQPQAYLHKPYKLTDLKLALEVAREALSPREERNG